MWKVNSGVIQIILSNVTKEGVVKKKKKMNSTRERFCEERTLNSEYWVVDNRGTVVKDRGYPPLSFFSFLFFYRCISKVKRKN